MIRYQLTTPPDTTPTDELGISIDEYHSICHEISQEPTWRALADKCMDYADGNQLDGELIVKMKALGIPPAVENIIAPVMRSVQGYEANTRTDWRVTPNGEVGGQDVADALNYKLNQAERHSRADKACSDAFESQIKTGIGWIEVAKEQNPFAYEYRCRAVHRNEIHWDMASREYDLSDARWLRRTRWLTAERIAQAFPAHKEMILGFGLHGNSYYDLAIADSLEGGISTGLQNAWNMGRASTLSEQHWYNRDNKHLCITELWYRKWVSVPVIKTPDGRAVEYDKNNPNHLMAVASGMAKPVMTSVPRVRLSYWIGSYLLHDGASPYAHTHFPYVPFWGFKEDMTGTPYGYIKDMVYAQDSLNSGLAKLRWGLSVVRVERTKGVVMMSDAQLRQQVARPDADIVLDKQELKDGGKFDVIRDYQLTGQHYQLLQDSRATVERTSGISQSFQGAGNASSGYQEQQRIEQSNQALADIMDNFRESRKQVGEILLSLIIHDLGQQPQTIIIEGDAITAERAVTINKPKIDPTTGQAYLSNDIQRTRLMVALEEVPSSTSYRSQQLNALSETAKALPPEYQVAVLPFMVSLMDMPHKDKIIEAIKNVQQTPSPDEIQAQIDQAVQEALANSDKEIKERELALKEKVAEVDMLLNKARAVQTGVQASYSAMQAGVQVAQMPMIAPIADEVMRGAGYTTPNVGHDPNFPTADETAAMNIRSPYIQGQGAMAGSEQLSQMGLDKQMAQGEQIADQMQVQRNTSPAYPPVPQEAPSAMSGIETPNINDNLP